MALVKHSKFKNTAILFELLVRHITSDTLSGKDSKSVNILKKYFHKTELGREYKLYESILKKTNLSEAKAEMIINTVLESAKQLNKSALRRQKYNLIKEIKESYDLDEFFKTKLPQYKAQAAIYTLFELATTPNPNTDQIINNKLSLLEHISSKPSAKKVDNDLINEFQTYDKDTRILTYKVLLEKFNAKHNNLNENQKLILKEFINSVDNTTKLKEFYNIKVKEIKSELSELNKLTKDKAIKIKVNEVSNMLCEADSKAKLGDDEMVKLLQYCDLLEELKLSSLN